MPQYVNPYAQEMVELMQTPARVRGNAAVATGAAQARAVTAGADAQARALDIDAQQNARMGQMVGTSLRDLSQLPTQIPQQRVETMKLRDMAQQYTDQQLTRDALNASKGDLTAALTALDAAGHVSAATGLRGQLQTARVKGLESVKLENETRQQALDQAGTLLSSVQASDTPAENYGRVLPELRKIVGKELAEQIPDAYDPAFVKQALTWGMTASEQVLARARIATAAKDAVQQSVTTLELHRKMGDYLGQWAQTVDNQDDWTKMIANAKALGAPAALLERVGDTYSADAKKRALGLLDDPKTPSYQHDAVLASGPNGKPIVVEAGYNPKENKWYAAGSTTPLENVRPLPKDVNGITQADHSTLVSGVIQNPDLWHNLTDTVKSALAPDLVRAGFTKFGVVDPGASRATAERWRYTALKDLDKRYIDSRSDRSVIPAMTDADKETERQRIEASYQAQLGNAPAAAPKKPDATPAPVVPAPAAAGKPSAAKAETVPAPVSALLEDQQPGTYTLSDKSTWKKNADGTITKAP